MKESRRVMDDQGDLRDRAEERIHAGQPEMPGPMSEDQARALVHELQIHQVELEMQNEELQRARREAEDAKEQYLDLYDFAPVGYFTFDVRGTILSANLTGAKLLGIERGRLVHRRFQLFVDVNSRRRFSAWVKDIITTGEKRTSEVTLLREGAPPICAQIEGIAVESAGGGERSCRAVVIDITERKRADEELRRSEERLNLLVQNSPLALVEFGWDHDIVRWTAEAQRLFGWTADEMLGKRISDVRWVYEEDWSSLNQLMSEMLYGERIWTVSRARNYRKDGTVIYCEWYSSLLHDAHGRVTGVLSLVLDVTGRTQAEDRLKHQVYLLQRALMPAEPPRIEGYSVASAYVPAYSGDEIGGDFLDVFSTEGGKVGILIGDVSGKGIGSAALAATTRSTIGAFAYDLSSPGDALAHANSILAARQARFEYFVTALLAILDPATGNICYSSAGHPPAMVNRADGRIELLNSHNLPLGIVSGSEFEQSESMMLPGDKVVLYTDGVTEARHDHDLLGIEGLESLLSSHGRSTPDELVAHILRAVDEWAKGKPRDDTAVLVIGRDT